jgi:hypothetical protein
MAAGLTDHGWTMAQLLHYQFPLAAWVAPKRRGRRSKHRLTLPRGPAPPASLDAAA